MRRQTIVILALAAVAAAVWLLWPSTPIGLEPPAGPSDRPEAPSAVPTHRSPEGGGEPSLAEGGGTVFGRVLLERDLSPVAGAEVHALPMSVRSSGSAARAETDAGGRYVLPLPPGRWSVFAWGSGVVSRTLTNPTADPGDLEVRVRPDETLHLDLLVSRAASVAGRVLDHRGAPVAAAAVAREGLAAASEPVRVFGGGTVEVVVELPEPRFVGVSVLEEGTDRPIIGAEVRAWWSPAARVWLAPRRTWTTGDDGRARVGPLPMQRVTLSSSAPGYGRPLGGTPPRETEEDRVVIRLPRAGGLAGRVVFPDGEPLSSGRLTVYCLNEAGGATNLAGHDPRLGPDGAFRVEGIPQGPVRLRRLAVRDGRIYRLDAETETGRRDLELVLEPAPGLDFDLVLLEPDGRPVPAGKCRSGVRASVSVFTFSDGLVANLSQNIDGRIRAEIYGARTRDGEPRPVGACVADFVPSPGEPHLLRLPPERIVRGVVVDPDGEPVAGARLVFRPTGLPPEGSEGWREAHADVRSAPDGSFRAGRLGDFVYRVEVRPPPGYAPVDPLDVRPDGGSLRIRLAKGARSRLTVIDADGEPIPGAGLRALRPDDTRGRDPVAVGRTDVDGIGVLGGLPAGEPLIFRVWAPVDRLDLARSAEVVGVPAERTIRLGRSLGLEVHVLDRQGEPVPGAQLRWRPPGEARWRSATAGSEGDVQLRHLPVERVIVRAAPASGDPGAKGVEEHVLPARGGTETIRIDRGERLRCVVDDWPGGKGDLWVLGEDGASGRYVGDGVDPRGRVEVEGVPLPATVLVRPKNRPAWCGVLRVHQSTGEIRKVTLTPGLRITGRVLLPDGVTWAVVLMPLPGRPWAKATVDGDGRFELPGIPPGTWTIRIQAGGTTREVPVAAGADVTIDFR